METMEGMTNGRVKERGQWGRKAEYFLSLLGYTVGLGTLWRFPYICLRNGGGAFMLPYLLCLLLFGIPLFFLETAVGQFSGKGMLHIWEICPAFKGVGVGMIIGNIIGGFYYNVILGWTIYYIANSFINPLPWTSCNNDWNTDSCVVRTNALPENYNVTCNGNCSYTNAMISEKRITNKSFEINGIISSTLETVNLTLSEAESDKKTQTATEEFWQNNVLEMSDGIHSIGHINWKIMLCLLAGWTLIGLCILKGVKSVGKVVYITATMPYILLTIVLVRGLTLDGGVEGVIAYLTPDFDSLLRPQVWIEAVIQVFYSLGIAWGPLFTMASFSKFDNNCLRDSVILSIISEGTCIYSGMIIYTILGFMAAQFSMAIKDVVKAGPGLAFMVYPKALAQLPWNNMWSVLFFVTLLFLGLDSLFAYCEAVIVACTDAFPWLHSKRSLFVSFVCLAQFIGGLLLVTQGGIYIFQLVDWYLAAYFPIIFGLIECIVFGWIYGMERFSRDVRMMIGRGIPVLIRICICIISPSFLCIFLVYSFVAYEPPTYGSYIYPKGAVVIGIFLSILPLIPVVICGGLAIYNSHGNSLLKKIGSSLKPTSKWRPSDELLREVYEEENYHRRQHLNYSFKDNIFG